MDAPQIWFGEPLSDNANDPSRYRDGYAPEATTAQVDQKWSTSADEPPAKDPSPPAETAKL